MKWGADPPNLCLGAMAPWVPPRDAYVIDTCSLGHCWWPTGVLCIIQLVKTLQHQKKTQNTVAGTITGKATMITMTVTTEPVNKFQCQY